MEQQGEEKKMTQGPRPPPEDPPGPLPEPGHSEGEQGQGGQLPWGPGGKNGHDQRRKEQELDPGIEPVKGRIARLEAAQRDVGENGHGFGKGA